jgi:transglutaminase-like putative cysteine protease
MQRLRILHRTYYNYQGLVRLEQHRLLLRPREGPGLHIESSRLEISPSAKLRWLRDAYDNAVALATFAEPATQLAIVSEIVVQQHDEAPLDFLVAEAAVNYPFSYETDTAEILRPYLPCLPLTDRPALVAWMRSLYQQGEQVQTYGLLARLCTTINRAFRYQKREQPGVQPVAETLVRGIGSCRDFACLFMEAARSLGLAARFVSGYLNAPSADGSSGSTHAWAEVYLPGAGWKGFDPTSGEIAGGRHIAVAVSRSPEEVSPVSGAFFGPASTDLTVGVWVAEM